jgi:hypothetical protein
MTGMDSPAVSKASTNISGTRPTKTCGAGQAAFSFLSTQASRSKFSAIIPMRKGSRLRRCSGGGAQIYSAASIGKRNTDRPAGHRDAAPGSGLGALLLADAVRRAYAAASSVGSCMLVVDAINEQAAAFYEANGFVRLPESLRLVLPMRAISKLVEA